MLIIDNTEKKRSIGRLLNILCRFSLSRASSGDYCQNTFNQTCNAVRSLKSTTLKSQPWSNKTRNELAASFLAA